MNTLRQKKGFTLVELIVVIAILIILAVISYPVATSLLERAIESADLETLHSLNSATAVYRVQNTPSDPFENASNNSNTLNQLLVDEGFLNKKAVTEQKYKDFYWNFTQNKWMLLNFLTQEQITMGSGGFTGSITGRYNKTASDIFIPETINGISISNIYQDVFSDCNLRSVTFPVNSSLLRIHARAFKNNKLTEVVFPDSLKRIDYGAFMDNEIVKVTIGDCVSLEGNVFRSNDKFKDAYVGKGTYYYVDDNWIKK